MKNTLNKIVNIYVLVMMVAFPLFMPNGYYFIHQAKMYFYLYSTIACFVLCVLAVLWYGVRSRSCARELLNSLKPSHLVKSLCVSDRLALGFLVITIVSTLSSEWLYEAFWGTTGRFQGGFLWFWYIVTYLLVSRFYVQKPWHIDIFLAGGLIVCGWSVLDFFGLSPIGIGYETLFSSTIGNINVLTAIEAMYLAAASVMLIGSGNGEKSSGLHSVYYYICTLVMFMGLECGRTANALFSSLFLVCFLPFFAFRSRKGILRYLAVLTAYAGSMVIVASIIRWLPAFAPDRDYWGELVTIGFKLSGPLAVMTLAAAAAAAAGAMYLKKSGAGTETDEFGLTTADRRLSKRLRIIWGILGLGAFCVLVFLFYDANAGGHAGRYGALSSLLVFDDSWGTNRGRAWGLAIKYYSDFSPFKKLIGSGPETFSVHVLIHDLNKNTRDFTYNFDSVHNELLQRLFETGIAGFLCYYGMIAMACVRAFRSGADKRIAAAAAAFAVLAYNVQSFVNISVPIVLPLNLLFTGVAAAAGREDHGEER